MSNTNSIDTSNFPESHDFNGLFSPQSHPQTDTPLPDPPEPILPLAPDVNADQTPILPLAPDVDADQTQTPAPTLAGSALEAENLQPTEIHVFEKIGNGRAIPQTLPVKQMLEDLMSFVSRHAHQFWPTLLWVSLIAMVLSALQYKYVSFFR